ncbi:conjugal transfer protein TraG N-terminal domain-containing protein [Campylobacter sp. MG1]|uniref:conjugal transfer protein TraG N-terminal domain-containing protein n=1 Tax=Campylobacter sp. MG1 TaxID=2976332 RepID=UPI00226CDF5A|nr:conjugal transfer protein TraG N-terminal domain-containing protein [Campylobacter sp. MG1]
MIAKYLILLCAFSNLLFAENTIYVYGYAETMANLLRSISLLYTSSGYRQYLLGSAFVIALLVVMFKTANNPKANPIVALAKLMVFYIITLVAFFYAGNSNAYTYEVKNITKDNIVVHNVSGVPFGLGKVLELTTTFERGLTDAMETALQPVDENVYRYSMAGFLYPLKAKIVTDNLNLFTEQEFMYNMTNYLNTCLFDYNSYLSRDDLISDIFNGGKEENLSKVFESIKTAGLSQGYLTEYKRDNIRYWATCKMLYDYINGDFNTLTSKAKADKNINTSLKLAFAGSFSNINETKTRAYYDEFINKWSNGITNANNVYKNSVLMNALDKTYNARAKLYGLNDAGIFSLSTSQLQAKQQFLINHQMSLDYLPELKATIHIIIVALSPLLLVFAFLFMSRIYIMTFITLHLWIVLWSPIITIINFIIIDKFEKVLHILHQQHISPFSLDGSAIINGKILDYMNWDGTLFFIVPLLALAIATGSAYAFTSIATSLGQHFNTSAMAGARAFTQMATASSQSIRDGDRTYTKDGTGLSMTTTDIIKGQKVDYTYKYGNSDTMQEVLVQGSNFSFKTNSDGMMTNGKFDNIALNKNIQNAINSGTQKQSGYSAEVGKSGSVTQQGSSGESVGYQNNDIHNETNNKEKSLTDSNNKSIDNSNTKSNSVTNSHQNQQKTDNTQGIKLSAGGTIMGNGGTYNIQAMNTSSMSDTIDISEQTNDSRTVKHGANVTKSDTEKQSEQDTKATNKTDAKIANISTSYTDNISYGDKLSSSDINTYSKTQSQSDSISQNTVAYAMNEQLMRDGGANMSVEQRIQYLSETMANIGNQSAMSDNQAELSNAFDNKIDEVKDKTTMVNTRTVQKEVDKAKKKVEEYKQDISNTNIKNIELKNIDKNIAKIPLVQNEHRQEKPIEETKETKKEQEYIERRVVDEFGQEHIFYHQKEKK